MPRNPFLCLAIVVALSTTLLICLSGGLILAYAERPIPQFIVAIASNCVGALAALLVAVPPRGTGHIPESNSGQANLASRTVHPRDSLPEQGGPRNA